MPRDKNKPKPVRVDINSLQPGPIRRDALSDEQTARLRRVHETFAEIDGFTFEQRLDGFKRDVNPDNEIAIWERMAGAYERFSAGRELSPAEKKDVYGLLLMRSMTSEVDTLQQVKLKTLSEDAAVAALREMR